MKHQNQTPQTEHNKQRKIQPAPLETTNEVESQNELGNAANVESQAAMLKRMPPQQGQNATLQMNRTQGNQHVQRVMTSLKSGANAKQHVARVPKVQTKLEVGAAGDQYEQEADQVASQVMRMAQPAAGTPPADGENSKNNSPTALNRYAQRASIQRSAGDAGGAVGTGTESQIAGMQQSGGKPMPETERNFFEPRMNMDLSGVRLHTGESAAQTSQDLNARAYTVGSDIAFNSGEYQPGTTAGRELMAHELTHVAQQNGVQRKIQREPIPETTTKQETPTDIVGNFFERKDISELLNQKLEDKLDTIQLDSAETKDWETKDNIAQTLVDLELQSKELLTQVIALEAIAEKEQAEKKQAQIAKLTENAAAKQELEQLPQQLRSSIQAKMAVTFAAAKAYPNAALIEAMPSITSDSEAVGLANAGIEQQIIALEAVFAQLGMAAEKTQTAKAADPEAQYEDALNELHTRVAKAILDHEKVAKKHLTTLQIQANLRKKAYSGVAQQEVQALEIKFSAESSTTQDDATANGVYTPKERDQKIQQLSVTDWAQSKKKETSLEMLELTETIQEKKEAFSTELQDKAGEAEESLQGWKQQNVAFKPANFFSNTFGNFFSGWGDQEEAIEQARAEKNLETIVNKLLEEGVADVPDLKKQIGLIIEAQVGGDPEIEKKLKAKINNIESASEWESVEIIGKAQNPNFDATDLAQEIRAAVKGMGTDEDKLFAALEGRTKEQILAMKLVYSAKYDRDMVDDIDDDVDSGEWERAKAALDGEGPEVQAAATLYNAMKGGGTDEDTIWKVLRNKSVGELRAIESAFNETYQEKYGASLRTALDEEMDDVEYDRAMALLSGDKAKADALGIRDAMNSGLFGWSTDEDAMEDIYTLNQQEVEAEAEKNGMTTAELKEAIRDRNLGIEGKYNEYVTDPLSDQDSKGNLRDDLTDEFSMDSVSGDLITSMADYDTAGIDAARIQDSIDGVFSQDKQTINVLREQYSRAEKDVYRDEKLKLQKQAQAQGWDEAQFNEEWEKKKATLETKVNQQAGTNKCDLDAAFRNQYGEYWRQRNESSKTKSGPHGTSYTSDTGSYESYANGGDLNTLLSSKMNPFNGHADIAEKLWQENGHLSDAQELYFAMLGAGTDEETIKKVLKDKSAAEIEKLKFEYAKTQLEEGGGGMSTEQTLYFKFKEQQTQGEEFEVAVEKYLSSVGYEASDINRISALFAKMEKKYVNSGELQDDLEWDLTGRDEFDVVTIMLQGKPKTMEQKLAILKQHVEYELGDIDGSESYDISTMIMNSISPAAGLIMDAADGDGSTALGRTFTGEEQDVLLATYREAEKLKLEHDQLLVKLEALKKKYPDPSNDEKAKAEIAALKKQSKAISEKFNRVCGYADKDIKSFRDALDAVAESVSAVLGAAVSIIVGVVSLGSATPAIIAAWSVAAGAAAGVLGKWIVLGSSYGAEDLGADLATLPIDLVMARLTAGLGSKLFAKVAKALAKSNLGEKAAMRILAAVITDTVEDVAGNLPGIMANKLINESLWDGSDSNPLESYFNAVFLNLAFSVAGSRVMDYSLSGGIKSIEITSKVGDTYYTAEGVAMTKGEYNLLKEKFKVDDSKLPQSDPNIHGEDGPAGNPSDASHGNKGSEGNPDNNIPKASTDDRPIDADQLTHLTASKQKSLGELNISEQKQVLKLTHKEQSKMLDLPLKKRSAALELSSNEQKSLLKLTYTEQKNLLSLPKANQKQTLTLDPKNQSKLLSLSSDNQLLALKLLPEDQTKLFKLGYFEQGKLLALPKTQQELALKLTADNQSKLLSLSSEDQLLALKLLPEDQTKLFELTYFEQKSLLALPKTQQELALKLTADNQSKLLSLSSDNQLLALQLQPVEQTKLFEFPFFEQKRLLDMAMGDLKILLNPNKKQLILVEAKGGYFLTESGIWLSPIDLRGCQQAGYQIVNKLPGSEN